jgi:hypothetical protein
MTSGEVVTLPPLVPVTVGAGNATESPAIAVTTGDVVALPVNDGVGACTPVVICTEIGAVLAAPLTVAVGTDNPAATAVEIVIFAVPERVGAGTATAPLAIVIAAGLAVPLGLVPVTVGAGNATDPDASTTAAGVVLASPLTVGVGVVSPVVIPAVVGVIFAVPLMLAAGIDTALPAIATTAGLAVPFAPPLVPVAIGSGTIAVDVAVVYGVIFAVPERVGAGKDTAPLAI